MKTYDSCGEIQPTNCTADMFSSKSHAPYGTVNTPTLKIKTNRSKHTHMHSHSLPARPCLQSMGMVNGKERKPINARHPLTDAESGATRSRAGNVDGDTFVSEQCVRAQVRMTYSTGQAVVLASHYWPVRLGTGTAFKLGTRHAFELCVRIDFFVPCPSLV